MKRLISYKQHFKVVFWLGICLITMGISAGITAGRFSAIPAGLLFAGLALLVVWLGLQATVYPQFWQRRSTQVSTNAIVASLSILIILGLVNFLAVRYVQRVDLTENKVFTLAPQSIQVIKNLPRTVKVIAFGAEPNPRLRALLEAYERQDNNNKLNVTFVNPRDQPQLAQEFNVKDFGDVYLTSGSRKQFVQSIQFEPLSEGKLTNAIEQIARDRKTRVYFLQGHGEALPEPGDGGYSQAATLLAEKNFEVALLDLSQVPRVPEDATVVIIAGPDQELLAGEVKALQDYLAQGGSLMLLTDPSPKLNFETLLQNWGIKLDSRLAINASQQQAAGMGPSASVVREYGNHPITQAFENRFSIYPFARALELTPAPNVEQTPLLITSQQTWAENDLKNERLEFNMDQGDRPGPLILGAALKRPAQRPRIVISPSPQPSASPNPEVLGQKTTPWQAAASLGPTKLPESRVVIIGNSRFAADGMFSQYVNDDLFLNAVSWLSKRDDQVLSISPKSIRNRRIEISQWQGLLVFLLAIVLIPLMGFGTAAAIWWKRR